MSVYSIFRTDFADSQIHKIVLNVAKKYGNDSARKLLDQLDHDIDLLSVNPYLGMAPKYRVFNKQGFRILIISQNLVFYKVNDIKKEIIIYAVVNERQDYLDIINGL